MTLAKFFEFFVMDAEARGEEGMQKIMDSQLSKISAPPPHLKRENTCMHTYIVRWPLNILVVLSAKAASFSLYSLKHIYEKTNF